jgi:hypothetical protein
VARHLNSLQKARHADGQIGARLQMGANLRVVYSRSFRGFCSASAFLYAALPMASARRFLENAKINVSNRVAIPNQSLAAVACDHNGFRRVITNLRR